MTETGRLTAALDDAQATLRTARLLLHAHTPQHMVDILRTQLLQPTLSSCILFLFGGDSEDAQPGQRAYMELQGTWSKRVGSGVGSGIRLYLNNYADLMARLDSEEVVYFPHPRPIWVYFDPLVRGFLRAERARSLALITLKARGESIGVLLLASDRSNAFDTDDLERFHLISEYLALNLYAKLLTERQQRLGQHYAAMLNAVRDGVVMVLPFDKGGRVFIANRYFKRLFELDDHDGEGDSLIDLLNKMRIAENTRQELHATWLSLSPRAPGESRGEFHLVTGEGQPTDIAWYSAPVSQGTQVLGRIYTFHDVTPERTAQKLRAAFLSRLSHELRTPLTSIRGFAEFILEVSGDQLPSLAREYTAIILESARHLNTLFTDLIEITRAEAGELKLNRREAYLPDIIIDTVARLELHYREREQQVIMELDDDLPAVLVDVDRITQVVSNLLANAIKYSPEKGRIRVITTLISDAAALPRSAPPGVVLPAVMVMVRDQGKGLSRDEVEQVFMPFYRTESVKRERIEGAGLGLAVARSILEVHRGKIWAAPRGEVRGGCFIFTIPTP
ncbi:MAG: ATP-binding protein [Chloroflexota bacterium]|nr:ATP-binding protein [Chloroflexota bacterium]